MNEIRINAIGDSIQEIIERTDEAKSVWEKDKSNQIEFGRLLAFAEVLSILQADLTGEEAFEKLLDFDIDKRYLCS